MIRYIISLIILSLLISCVSNNAILSDNIPYEMDISKELVSEDLITDETIKQYDLTILKGGSYPTIVNDTPFTEIELTILNREDGLEYRATPDVAHYFKYFLRDKHELLESWIKNSMPYISDIRKEIINLGLPQELIYLPFLESGYNPMAYSRAGAGGIWQFMPLTARDYGIRVNWWIDERRSPQIVTPFALQHLSYLFNKFDDWYLALASYNAGEGRISTAIKKAKVYNYFDLIESDVLPMETRKYVPQLMAIVKIMKNLDSLGFETFNWDRESNLTKVKIPKGLDLIEFSKNVNLSEEDFSRLNPIFRRDVNDPSYEPYIFIPTEYNEIIRSYLSNIDSKKYMSYYVKNGDTWWSLSNNTATPILTLKRLNNTNSNTLNVGQHLLLPEFKTEEVKYIKNRENLKKYVVKSGDTISSISIKYNIKLNSLYKENSLNSHSILHIGQVLSLPGYPVNDKVAVKKASMDDNYYIVKNGDSVWLIAQKTKIPYKNLLTLNNLDKNSKLKIGDKLLLY